MPFARTLLLLTLAGALTAPAARAQAPDTTSAATLRALYFRQDYAGALAAGRTLLESGKAPPDAVAWLVASMAADGRVDDARAAAEALARRHLDEGWSNFARAAARLPQEGPAPEALAFAVRAREAAALDPDFAWLHATVWLRNHSPNRAAALLDSVGSHGVGSPQLVVLRGEIDAARAFDYARPGDPARALANFQTALELDSTLVSAWVGRARVLEVTGPPTGAYEALRRARDLAPLSAPVHLAFWQAALARPDVSDDSARREVLDDATRLAQARPGWASTLHAQATLFRMLGLTARADSTAAELAARFPGSFEAEALALDALNERAAELDRTPPADSVAARAELRRRLLDFVASPGRRPASLGRAYAALLELARRDTSVTGAEIDRIVEGVERYGQPDPRARFSSAVLLAAERGGDVGVVERLAREIPEHVQAEDRMLLALSPDTSLPAQLRLSRHTDEEGQARLHDALGWLYLCQGLMETADPEIRKAVKDLGDDPVVLFHAACVADRLGRADEAEKLYVRALMQEGAPAEPRIDAGLRALYARRHGSLAGYDTVVAAARTRQLEARRAQVLRGRVKNPRKLPYFRLARLEGGTFSSDQLKGKIAIVNFWGTWCPPCREEVPQIQQLFDKYRSDPDVVLLTIDEDPDLGLVRSFLAYRRLSFPVLLDAGFARGNILGFPTTWLVDRQGRIVYDLLGLQRTTDLVEQLAWRVESLRDTSAAAVKASPKP